MMRMIDCDIRSNKQIGSPIVDRLLHPVFAGVDTAVEGSLSAF